ncbi:MAG: PCRF domain-containing protein, partial [Patescibacteria group bacterium]
MKLEEIEAKILEIEAQMSSADFWADKAQAQKLVKELQELKTAREGGGGTSGPYDSYDAILTIFSGAGGDDAEDFSSILLNMYLKFFSARGWSTRTL